MEEEKAREAPVFVSKPEPCTVQEGDCARFCCRVTGYPRPRVVWLINDHTVVNVSGTIYDSLNFSLIFVKIRTFRLIIGGSFVVSYANFHIL